MIIFCVIAQTQETFSPWCPGLLLVSPRLAMADQIQCLLRLTDSYWANCLCGLGYSSVTQQKSRITYILRLRERQITSFHIFKTPFNFMLCQCFGVDGAIFFGGGWNYEYQKDLFFL